MTRTLITGAWSALGIFTAVAVTACLPRGGGGTGPVGSAQNPAVLASVEGLEEADRQRDLQYKLICDNGKEVDGARKTVGGEEYVAFEGTGLADGDICAMEILAEVDNPDAWTWFGVENGNIVQGLLYGSDKGVIEEGRLSLTLYKLYARDTATSFDAKLPIRFALAEEASMPSAAQMKGSLRCGEDKYPGDYSQDPEVETEGTLTFTLDAPVMNGRSCEEVVVLVDNEASYKAQLEGVSFDDPNPGDVLTFNGSDRVVVEPIQVDDEGDVLTETEDGDTCFSYDREAKECLDRRTVELPYDETYWIAAVQGLRDGERVTYLASSGDGRVAVDASGAVTIKALNKSTSNTYDSHGGSYTFWPESQRESLLSKAFDQDFVDGVGYADNALKDGDLSGVRFLNIKKVWVHGLVEVDGDHLEGEAPTRWLAAVTASKAGEDDQAFFVTGWKKYFASAEKPLTGDADGYFSFDSFAEDMASAAEKTPRWRIYAWQGGAMAPDGCEAERRDYLGGISARHAGSLAADADDLTLYENCEVPAADFDAGLTDGWDIEVTRYGWDWYVLDN